MRHEAVIIRLTRPWRYATARLDARRARGASGSERTSRERSDGDGRRQAGALVRHLSCRLGTWGIEPDCARRDLASAREGIARAGRARGAPGGASHEVIEPSSSSRLPCRRDLAYRFKTPWRDGTTHVLMERNELLERLAPLIPPPRAHQLRYHEILAPCASGRSQVVPGCCDPNLGVRKGRSPVLQFEEAAASLAVVGFGLRESARHPMLPTILGEPVLVACNIPNRMLALGKPGRSCRSQAFFYPCSV
jgi:hypothetical protein